MPPGIGYGGQGPGYYLTRNNRLARMLGQMPDTNTGTHTGGLAQALRMGMQGYFMGQDLGAAEKDRSDRIVADEAIAAGLSPEVLPEGQQGPPQAGSIDRALQGVTSLPDNAYAGRLARDLQLRQFDRDDQMQRQQEMFKFQQQNTMLDAERYAEAMGLVPGTPEYNEFMKTAALAAAGKSTPAAIKEWNAYQTMSEPERAAYLTMKRANPWIDHGDVRLQYNPAQPGMPVAGRTQGVAPAQKVDVKGNRVITAPAIPSAPLGAPAPGPVGAPQAVPPTGMPQVSPPLEAPPQPPAGPSVTSLPPSREDAATSTADVDKMQRGIAQLDELIAHPGMEGMVGMPSAAGLPSRIPFGGPVWGTPEAGFEARVQQIEGSAFLQAFQDLKGGGHITEIEGEKATQAVTRMGNLRQGEDEWLKAAREFREILVRGAKRAQAASEGRVAPPAEAPSNVSPSIDDIMKQYGG